MLRLERSCCNKYPVRTPAAEASGSSGTLDTKSTEVPSNGPSLYCDEESHTRLLPLMLNRDRRHAKATGSLRDQERDRGSHVMALLANMLHHEA